MVERAMYYRTAQVHPSKGSFNHSLICFLSFFFLWFRIMTTVDNNIQQGDDDDGFHFHTTSKKIVSYKKVYIGNLPDIPSLKEKLQALVNESITKTNSTVQSITINRGGKSLHAIVDCQAGADEVISKLDKYMFDGRRINVQRERRGGGAGGGGKRQQGGRGGRGSRGGHGGRGGKNKGFGSSWSKPSSVPPPSSSSSTTTTIPSTFETNNNIEDPPPPPTHIDEASENIADIVSNEFEIAKQNGEDPINLAIASTAAMTLLATSLNVIENENHMEQTTNFTKFDGSTEQQVQQPNEEKNYHNKDIDITAGGFQARCAQPLSALLADFGEADPNWMNQQPKQQQQQQQPQSEKQNTIQSDNNNNCRLARHGTCPIHVEFTSFGYLHGAPRELKNGWSYTQPLPSIDCRDYPTVPSYLEWQDGLSSAVRRALLEACDGDIKRNASNVAKETFDAVEEAITTGGCGYASPIKIVIFVGSHTGRHRSVLLCEIAATALRNLLRANDGNRISIPISVGTYHRNIDRQAKHTTEKNSKQHKRHDLEGDW